MSVTRESVFVSVVIGCVLYTALFATGVVATFPVGICFGPLTFSVRTVDFHGGASISFVVDYIAGSWFPGRNM